MRFDLKFDPFVSHTKAQHLQFSVCIFHALQMHSKIIMHNEKIHHDPFDKIYNGCTTFTQVCFVHILLAKNNYQRRVKIVWCSFHNLLSRVIQNMPHFCCISTNVYFRLHSKWISGIYGIFRISHNCIMHGMLPAGAKAA